MADGDRLRVGLEVGKAAGIADGIGRYARCLLRALLELEGGHRLLLFDLSDDRLCDPELPPLTAAGGVDEGLALDVFHSTGPALPPAGPVPLVVTVHDLTVVTHAELHTAANRARVVAALVEAVARGALLIAVSDHTRRELLERLAVPEDRVVVVHEAPDAVFRPADGEPEGGGGGRRFRFDGPYMVAVGSLEPRKNLVGLMEAMALLPPALAGDMTLVVVGPGGWRNRDIRERMERARQRLRIVEVGYVSNDELVDLYRGATVFAYPSLSEGFGLPVLEAMACGAPVLTSDRTSLPEVAGRAAVLVDPTDPAAMADALGRMLGDRALREELVRKGFENVRRFSWRRCAAETLAVYERAAAERRAS